MKYKKYISKSKSSQRLEHDNTCDKNRRKRKK